MIQLRPFIDQMGQPESMGYRRPEDVEFDDGTSLARYMPMSAGGKQMRGVVVPHAKPMGGSRAYDPHKPPHRRVHIDPHIEGQSVVVDLGQITEDIAREAMELGQEYADKHADQVHGVDQIRLRSSAAFHLIGASQRAQAGAAPAPAQPASIISIPQGAPEPPPPPPPTGPGPSPSPSAGPRTIKAASFNGAPAQPATAAAKGGLLDAYQTKARPPREIDMTPAAVTGLPIDPPSRKVTFGIPGFGLHEAHYHDVNISDQLFVLVWDERFQGGSKYLPQIDGSFAARVDGDPMDYKLVWPGQMFTDKRTGQTYFQLLIEERVPQGEAPP